MSINKEIETEVQQRLSQAQAEHEVTIIYACESGSRAWGFASPDSDYDVRFIYSHKPDWYLTFDVERQRDVIEYPIVDDIDIGGWDIRKALHLFTRTNGALLEWINSPIQYREVGTTASQLRALATVAFNDTALKYHYSHMARRNARGQLKNDKVKLKKYFYILRPLLAIRYIEQAAGPPPVRFQALLDAVAPESIKHSILQLIELKKHLPESGLGDHIPAIDEFIYTELSRQEGVYTGRARPDMPDKTATRQALNNIFRNAISTS